LNDDAFVTGGLKYLCRLSLSVSDKFVGLLLTRFSDGKILIVSCRFSWLLWYDHENWNIFCVFVMHFVHVIFILPCIINSWLLWYDHENWNIFHLYPFTFSFKFFWVLANGILFLLSWLMGTNIEEEKKYPYRLNWTRRNDVKILV
jgi:hypothetical protein